VKSKSSWLYVALGLALIVGCIDEHPYVPTFTEYVLDLVNNHTEDQSAAPYERFKDLPDPDGDTNNTSAYDSLFR